MLSCKFTQSQPTKQEYYTYFTVAARVILRSASVTSGFHDVKHLERQRRSCKRVSVAALTNIGERSLICVDEFAVITCVAVKTVTVTIPDYSDKGVTVFIIDFSE